MKHENVPCWWNIEDLNLGQFGYEPSALTNCTNVPYRMNSL